MADWKRNLRRASFRGMPFYTESHGGDHGRRWADHEYPGRDTPYAEDLGRRQRVWRFTGYLIGDEYPGQRDQLVQACEQDGPGELVHPTIGTVQAVCRSISHSETRDRGRAVTLNFEFAEAGQLTAPLEMLVPASVVAASALPLGQVTSSAFLRGFDTSGGGPWLAQAALGQITGLSTQLQQARLPAPGVDQGPLNRALATLYDDAPALSADPPRLSAACDTAFTAFTEAGEAVPVVSAMLRFAAPATTLSWLPSSVLYAPFGMVGGPAIYQLPMIERRRINTLAFETYTRCLALREVGYAVPGIPLSNYNEAIELLNAIALAFIELEGDAADAGDDHTFSALANLRAAITHLIRARASNLNPLISYRIMMATPANSLTLAWRLYQDSGRDLEVVSRTVARNPAFLPFSGRVLAP
jgi:hypothetical protein